LQILEHTRKGAGLGAILFNTILLNNFKSFNQEDIMKRLWLLTFLYVGIVLGDELPITSPIRDQFGFETMDEAASAAVNNILTVSKELEYAGVIWERSGRYYFTNPITTGSDGDVGSFKIALYPNSKIVALYHTHPMMPHNDVFSSADVKFADDTKWTSYVGVITNTSHIVIRYVPGKTKKSFLKDVPAAGTVSEGEFVNRS